MASAHSILKHWFGPPRPFTSTIAKATVFTQPGLSDSLGPSAGRSKVVNDVRFVFARPTVNDSVTVSVSPAESVTRSVAVTRPGRLIVVEIAGVSPRATNSKRPSRFRSHA